MAGRLAGKRALVTAAGQGIGRETAAAFVREGANVIATDRSAERLLGLPTLDARPLDVTDRHAVRALAGELGRIDVLFNCVGVVHHGTILDCAESDWDASLRVNVTSMYYTISEFLPGMLAQGSGSIINMSSVVSSVTAASNRCAYGASKAAVIGLTKSVALDYATLGIRCNAICPGTVESPSLAERMEAESVRSGRSLDAVRAAFEARQPMGRVGKPEEIAMLAVYLASDESAFTTGAVHVIAGGWAI